MPAGATADLVGRTVVLRFGQADATPDLHEFGDIAARVERSDPEGSPPTPVLRARVLAPPALAGLSATLRLRYEGETLDQAQGAAPVTVTAMLEDATGRAVGGGLAALRVDPA